MDNFDFLMDKNIFVRANGKGISENLLNLETNKAHRENRLRNDKGIIGLWKKYILLYKCRQNQRKNNL